MERWTPQPTAGWGRVSDLGSTGREAQRVLGWLCHDGIAMTGDSSPSGAGAISELVFGGI